MTMINETTADGSTIEDWLSFGEQLLQRGQYAEAEASVKRAIERYPNHALAYHHLGIACQLQGDHTSAITAYKQALAIDPDLQQTRRYLALLLARLGYRNESLTLCQIECRTSQGLQWLRSCILKAMMDRNLGFAGELAAISASLRWGSKWYPKLQDPSVDPLPIRPLKRKLTIAKLQHDIQQFSYLQYQGIFGTELTPVILEYQRAIDQLKLNSEIENISENAIPEAINSTYNRIIHIRQTPRISQVFSGQWNPEQVEKQYLEHPLGLVVIDDFLSRKALEEIRAFCLESTIWCANRYAYGRLGAFFHDGFNCPLLLQIAEELRAVMPHVIGDRHTLRQMWGYKYSPYQPGASSAHADFAAVNVNFWVTPAQANLDPSCGGLVVYDVDAPRNWDFHTYNGRSDIIRQFLQRQSQHVLKIPYRQNRAIIFNSDLFHGTDTVRFRSEYENRRINVTMLYGIREEDHRYLSQPDPLTDPGYKAWRSAAFLRSRRSINTL